MKIKLAFQLHTIGDENIAIPSADTIKDFNGMVRLNKTGAFLWNELQSDCTEQQLVLALLEKYNINQDTASNCLKNFIEQMNTSNFLDYSVPNTMTSK